MFSPRWHLLLSVTLLGTSLSLASGCATGSQTRHGIPAGQWQARMPSTKSPIAELAFGRGGNGARADLSDAELAVLTDTTPDLVLQPMAAAKTVAVAKPKPRRALPVPAASVAVEPASAEPAPTPRVVEAAPAPLLASNDTQVEHRYAQREQASQDQQKFRGGDAIIISAGALVVVLLIVILILLLR